LVFEMQVEAHVTWPLGRTVTLAVLVAVAPSGSAPTIGRPFHACPIFAPLSLDGPNCPLKLQPSRGLHHAPSASALPHSGEA